MKKAIVLVLFFLSLNVFSGEYCVFPFKNNGSQSLDYMRYGFEVYIEWLFNENICDRIGKIENLDIPLKDNYSLATEIVIAKKMNANYMITGDFKGDEDNLTLILKVFKINGPEDEYVFKGSLRDILNNRLKSFFKNYKNFNWPLTGKLDMEKFKNFADAIFSLCIKKDTSLAGKYVDSFQGNDFYLRSMFYRLYDVGESGLAEKYFSLIKKKKEKDFLYEGIIKANKGDYDDAMDLFKKGNELKQDYLFLNNIAGCYLLKGEYNSAYMVYPFENKECPFLINGAIISLANEKYHMCLTLLKNFSSKFGLSEDAKDLICFLLNKKGIKISRFSEAKNLNDVVNDFNFLDDENCMFDNIESTIQGYKEEANRLFDAGEKEKAEKYFLKAIQVNPFDQSVLNKLCGEYGDSDACNFLKLMEAN